MLQNPLAGTAETILKKLSLELPNRSVGRPGNRAATDYFAAQAAAFAFQVERPTFDCIDWAQEGATLRVGDREFPAQVSPFSLSCSVNARLVVVATIEELEAARSRRQVLLVQGELAKEQLMPKNFPFYNPDEHHRIIAAIEAQQPAAVIAATARNPEMAGALYPFPLIEDGDFDIPSVYTTDDVGVRLAGYAGERVSLEIRSRRIPASGCNVIARKGGGSSRRVVVFAHIDAKDGTPGALDNAAGVTVLLLLAQLLEGYSGGLQVELVAMNGEDYYACPGEIQWLAANSGRLGDILLGINIDAAGYTTGPTAFSMYNCPGPVDQATRRTFARFENLVEGDPWYQSDHSLFIQNGVPALAITSQEVFAILADIAHTQADRPEMVDADKLTEAAQALRDLIGELDGIVGEEREGDGKTDA